MSLRAPFTLLLAAAVLCGCHATPRMAAFIENRNAEARLLEDEYWYQVQENERLAHELAKLKRAPAKGGPRGGIFGPRSAEPGVPENLEPPMIEEGIGPPAIETRGTPPSDEPQRPEIEAEPAPELPGELPTPRGATPAAATLPDATDTLVTHLFLNSLHTGGIDLDGRPGDDGLSVVLQPRNAAGQFVPLPGKVTVALLDPQKQGEAARIGRWTFIPDEIEPAINSSGDVDGIHLEVPWPGPIPESSALRLFVRYETADGRKIEADREIHVKLAGQFSERWTPRPPERQRRSAPVPPAIARVDAERGEIQASEEPADIAHTPSAAPPVLPPPTLGGSLSQSPPRPQWKPYR